MGVYAVKLLNQMPDSTGNEVLMEEAIVHFETV